MPAGSLRCDDANGIVEQELARLIERRLSIASIPIRSSATFAAPGPSFSPEAGVLFAGVVADDQANLGTRVLSKVDSYAGRALLGQPQRSEK
jgi:hypothetical protein